MCVSEWGRERGSGCVRGYVFAYGRECVGEFACFGEFVCQYGSSGCQRVSR